jgi:hypothetical protein
MMRRLRRLRERQNLRRLAAPLALVAAGVLGCADLSTDPATPVAIEFDSIPYPAIIAGDTMRDSLGVASPLRGVAYNGKGDVIDGAPFQFVSLDTGVTISPEGFLIATRRDGFVRLVATAGGLPSPPRRIEVTRSPDAVAATGETTITYGYVVPDVAGNVSPTLTVQVTSTDVAGGVSPNVAGWLVRWRAVHAGDTLGAGDTTLVALLGEGTQRTMLDTTGTDGTSARRLRVFANRLTATVDSFIVVAEVRRHGVQLAGSPVRFVVNVQPAAP